jgi:2-C-methyl-D-erythritol 4-phosphate cytidylyltransferase
VPPAFHVILPAAGHGTRFGGDKLAADLHGRSVLATTVAAFAHRDDVRRIIVATPDGIRPGHLPPHEKLITCSGGVERVDTVAAAVAQIDDADAWLAVHDAARPLPSPEVITRCFEAAVRYGASVPCTRPAGTVKQAANEDAPPLLVMRTLPRRFLWIAQTPQCCRRADWLAARAACPEPPERVTDDALLLELAGRRVTVVQGEDMNLKITTKLDLHLARLLSEPTGHTPPP